MDKLRVIFFSSGDFAIPTLNELITKNNMVDIVGIVTSRDKTFLHDRRISDIAAEHNIPYIVPKDINDDETYQWLSNIPCDVYCVISYKKLSERLISLPSMCSFNIHGSVLPLLRGAAPINWAIRYGFKESGVTGFLLDNKIDHGNIVQSIHVEVDDCETYGSLFDKLSNKCIDITNDILSHIMKRGRDIYTDAIEQPNVDDLDCCVDYFKAPKITHDYFSKADCEELESVARSVYPFDGIPCEFQVRNISTGETTSVKCKVFKLHRITSGEYFNHPAHTDNYSRGVNVMCDGKNFMYYKEHDNVITIGKKETNRVVYYAIDEIQISGKKRMQIKEFVRGFKFFNTKYLDKTSIRFCRV